MTDSIAHQNDQALGGRASVLVRQRRDHTELGHLIAEVEATSGVQQDGVLNDLCRLVFPHAFAEEAVLWPLIRKRIPDGERLTNRIEQEHQQINELFSELERTPHAALGRKELLDNIFELLREDVRDEEDELLPKLRDSMTVVELRRAGMAWDAVRRIAPTRPHPVVARRPPGNIAAALPLSAIDRTRDALDGVHRGGAGFVSGAARRASTVLASVAGALEHVPPFTRGEDPSTRRTDG